MATWCLIKSEAEKFKKALKNGDVSPEKLVEMTSAQRREYLAKWVGEANAKQVNALFESKLLLKNQQAGMISWAKKISGITPKVRRDLINKIERLDQVLNPSEEAAFLEDLASTRLGVDITHEEAQQISELSKKVSETKALSDINGVFSTEKARMDYGRARVDLLNYVNGLKEEANKIPLKDYLKKPSLYGKAVSNTAGTAKSLKASLDNSAIFRQGWKSLFTHPGSWQKNARRTFVDMVRTYGNKPVMDEINADLVSRPNAINGNYERMKLALGNLEEAYPTSLPEKIPVFGKIYKASENAYTGFVYRQRADIADKYIQIAEKQGVDLTNKELQSIGKLVNSLTGRGNLGKGELVANEFNNIFFSPRKLKGDIDLLTLHAFDKDFSSFARKQAAVNIVRVISGIAAIMGAATAACGDCVEWDPRSSDFGKIRVGASRFDVTGGLGSIIILASRILTQSTKSSTTGEVSKINSGEFGAKTVKDLVYDFFENKLSPVAAVVKDLAEGQDFTGNKPTLTGTLNNLFTPLPITTYQELKDNPDAPNILASMILDGLGIAVNTYPNANIKSGAVPEGEKISNEELIRIVKTYAKALGTDPETAFNRIFTGQKIVKVDNGTIKVQRMALKDSTNVKKKLGGNNPSMKLDHTIPLELGGDNSDSNLKLVTTAQWSSYTQVENALGKALKTGKINKKDAQEMILDFKQGKLTKESVLNRIK